MIMSRRESALPGWITPTVHAVRRQVCSANLPVLNPGEDFVVQVNATAQQTGMWTNFASTFPAATFPLETNTDNNDATAVVCVVELVTAIWLQPDPALNIGPNAPIEFFFPQTAGSNVSLTVHGSQQGEIPGTIVLTVSNLLFTPTVPYLPGERISATLSDDGECGFGKVGSQVVQFDVVAVDFCPESTNALSYAALQTFGSLPDPQDVTAFDLEGDGDLDLVFAQGDDSDSLVFRNDGSGMMTMVANLSAEDTRAVTTGDLNGDGLHDIVFAGHEFADFATHGDGGHLFFNQGSGIFSAATLVGGFPSEDVELADIDCDGDLDMIVASFDRFNPVPNEIFLNDGLGTFSAHTTLGDNGVGLTVCDFENDGDLDVVVLGPLQASLWSNQGDGTFLPIGFDTNLPAMIDVAAGDLNADGLCDLVFAGTDFSEVRINTGGGFTTPSPLNGSAGFAMQEVNLGDMDGDGDLDVVLANSNVGGPSLWLNDGMGNFTESGIRNLQGNGLALADLDGDGDFDVALSGGPTNTFTNICLATANLLPLDITKTAHDDLIELGNCVAYTICVTNPNPEAVTNVLVTDVLPPEVTLLSVAGATCTNTSDTTWQCHLDVAAADTTCFTMVCLATNDAALIGTTISNVAELTNGRTAITFNDLIATQGVVVTKTQIFPTLGDPLLGDPIAFEIRVTNTSFVDFASLRIEDLYDTNILSFTAASLAPTDPSDDGQLNWNFTALASGSSITFQVSFQTVREATGQVNRVFAVPIPSAPSCVSNSFEAKACFDVLNPLVQVDKFYTTTNPVTIGETLSFDLVVSNVGNVAVPAFELRDVYPTQVLAFVSATPAPTRTTPPGELGWTNLGVMAVGQSITVEVNFVALQAVGSETNRVDIFVPPVIPNIVTTSEFPFASFGINASPPPTVTCPATTNVSCLFDVPAPDASQVTAFDSQGASLTSVFHSGTTNEIATGCQWQVEHEYAAVDSFGTTGFCTHVIQVIDTNPPTVMVIGTGTIFLGCNATNLPLPDLDASDNCGVVGTNINLITNGLGTCTVTVFREYEIYDACSNAVLATQIYAWTSDTDAPFVVGDTSDGQLDCNTIALPPIAFAFDDACSRPTSDRPDGVLAFVDSVVEYDPTFGGGGLPQSSNHTNPASALGPPDTGGTNPASAVSIGFGGRITLEFQSHFLTGSGDATPDLHVFEVGVSVEDTFVEISKDGINWFAVGNVAGGTDTVDIDAFGFGSNDLFRFVRLRDDPNADPGSNNTPGADIDAVGALTAIPNPSGTDTNSPITVSIEEISYPDSGCTSFVDRIVTATDHCSNQIVITQSYWWINDSAPPELIVPSNQVTCTPTYEPLIVTSFGCGGSLTQDVSTSTNPIACGFEIIRSWIVQDVCGNSTSAFQVITQIVDTAAPELIAPPNQIRCNPIFEDLIVTNIGCASVVTQRYSISTSTAECVTIFQRIWNIEDFCGNIASATQVITQVVDSVAPVLIAPPDRSGLCNPTNFSTNTFGAPDVSDNCTATTLTYSDAVSRIDCSYVLTRTFIAIDGCSNRATTVQFISYTIDTHAPTLSNILTNWSGCNLSLHPTNTGSASFTDDCSSVTASYVDTTNRVGCTLTVARVWSTTDGCSNHSASVTQRLTNVINLGAPALTIPSDTTASTASNASTHLTGAATAIDDCGEPAIRYRDSAITSDCDVVITRLWEAEDICGLVSSGIQEITILRDVIPPVISVPANRSGCNIDTNVFTDPIPGARGRTANVIIDPPLLVIGATATDNCSSVRIDHSDTVSIFGCTTRVTRVWTATDEAGNQGTGTQILDTVTHTEPPDLSCPNRLTFTADAQCQFPLSLLVTNLPGGCGTVTLTQDPPTNTLLTGEGPHFVTVTAMDRCSNQTSCVIDVYLLCPAGITISHTLLDPLVETGSTVEAEVVICNTGQTTLIQVPLAYEFGPLLTSNTEADQTNGSTLVFTSLGTLSPGNCLTQRLNFTADLPGTYTNSASSAPITSSGSLATQRAARTGQIFDDGTPVFSVGGLIWFDLNQDGQQQITEPPLRDIGISLGPAGSAALQHVRSALDGRYEFQTLIASNLMLAVDLTDLPLGIVPTVTNQGSDATDSDFGAAGILIFDFDASPMQFDFGAAPTSADLRVRHTMYSGHDGGASCPGDGELVARPGQAVTYCIDVRNTGTMDLPDIDVFSTAIPWSTNIGLTAGGLFQTYAEGVATDLLVSVVVADTRSPFGEALRDADSVILREADRRFIGNRIWRDDNQNGIQDEGEPGLPGVTLQLLDETDAILATAVSDGQGQYLFPDQAPGFYRIRVQRPPGFFVSPRAQGGDPAIDSDIDPATETSLLLELTAETTLDIDVGLFEDFDEAERSLWKHDTGLDATSQSGPQDDPDRDGESNEKERRAGTDPLDGRDYLRIQAFRSDQDRSRLVFPTAPARTYRVEMSNRIGAGADWIPVARGVPGTGLQRLIEHLPSTGSARHYRIVVEEEGR